VELIDGNWKDSLLSKDIVAALKFTDHFILTPGPISDETRSLLLSSFTQNEIAELSIGVALFHGFSKMLIALGREPEEMDTTIVPTPQLPDSAVSSANFSSDFSHLFTHIPDIGMRWEILEGALLSIGDVPDSALSLLKHRMSELLGVNYLVSDQEITPIENSELLRDVSENFVFDIRSISSDTRREISEIYSSEGLLQLMFAMALYDGILRMEATKL
tara:strand:- start:2340 stop:2993 length:654 start_codon:yes stop_codon:yes gene_type:complete